MNIKNTLINTFIISVMTTTTASALTLCNNSTPKKCVEITKVADQTITGSYYYTCPTTIDGKISQGRLTGNCKNETTCATLESLYQSTFNSMEHIKTKMGKMCDLH